MEEVITGKKEQRKKAMAARQALSSEERAEFSRRICERLQEIPALKNAKSILSYLSTWDEADPSVFDAWAEEHGIKISYPVSYKDGIMKAYRPLGPESIHTGKYGIKAPVEEASEAMEPETLDAVIVPCVAFNPDGRRLGHGAGYYDRYLPLCPDAEYVLIAFEAQILDDLTVDLHDTPMDAIVTEKAVYYPSEVQEL